VVGLKLFSKSVSQMFDYYRQAGIRFHFLIYSIDKKRYNDIGNTFYIMVKNRV